MSQPWWIWAAVLVLAGCCVGVVYELHMKRKEADPDYLADREQLRLKKSLKKINGRNRWR